MPSLSCPCADESVPPQPPPPPAFGHRLFSPAHRAEIASKLSKTLPPELLASRPGPGGTKFTYLEGHRAITIAHEIFGFEGWSHSIVETTIDYMDVSRDAGTVNVGVSCVVRVTLKDGTWHEDIGYGYIDNARGKGMALEKAKKEAVTDGLKRALKTFGNALGNCVYNKDAVRSVMKMPPAKPQALNSSDLYTATRTASSSNHALPRNPPVGEMDGAEPTDSGSCGD
ncbi:DNA repair and recombination protein [Zopfochytrium polystomum]|nr:DNA repair and recombination protein [Zopfochytrium polystomum]